MEFVDICCWTDYEPIDSDYVEYPTFITSAMFQVIGVYDTLCRARTSLEFIECNDYGKLITYSGENDLAFIRKMFIENSIIYYNICVDLSWQVLWLYLQKDDLNIIYNEKKLNKILKTCNYNDLIRRLKLDGLEKIIEKLEEFKKYLDESGVRTKYNYIKHRGVYHYNGVGENYGNMIMGYNGMYPKIFSRKEIDIEKWKKMLLEFDTEFVEYFNYILQEIVPSKYLEKINMADAEYMNKWIKYCDELIRKQLIGN